MMHCRISENLFIFYNPSLAALMACILRIVTINEEKSQHDLSMLNVRRDICGYCGCCVSVCPEGALELIDAYLSVENNCTSCGICAKVCPLGALEVVDEK